MNLIINEEVAILLKEKGISLDEYFIIWAKYQANGWLIKARPAVEYYESLKLKGLLTATGELSAVGSTFVEEVLFLLGVAPKNNWEERFETFWDLYPRDDSNAHFRKTRVLRSSRSGSKREFLKVVSDGADPDLIIRRLQEEIAWRVTSTTSTRNPFQYMKSALNWLKDRAYENETVKPVAPRKLSDLE